MGLFPIPTLRKSPMSDTAVATVSKPRASIALAAFLGMAPDAMIDVLKAQCFKCPASQVTDGQMAAFVSIANEMQVNPLLPGMLYAFPVQGGGIVPMMGPDGVFKKLAEHPNIDSWETIVYPEDVSLPPTHATSFIYMKGRSKPLTKTCLFSEWKMSSNPNWASRPRHMLEMRALKQNSRQVIHGIPFDEDERRIMGEVNVTPEAETHSSGSGVAGTTAADTTPKRSDPPARSRKDRGANAIPPDKKSDSVDIVATPAKDPAPSATENQAELPTASAPKPRTTLSDKERVELVCRVVEVTPQMIKVAGVATPSVGVSVDGEFTGTIFHFGGASLVGDKIVPQVAWSVGNDVRVKLLGRLNNASKQVLVVVESVEVEGAADKSLEVS